MKEDPVQAIRDAVDVIVRISDHGERARAATAALAALSDANTDLAQARRDDIHAMHAGGLSYREIGAELDLHYTRVRHIERGTPTGTTARARARASAAGEAQ